MSANESSYIAHTFLYIERQMSVNRSIGCRRDMIIS